MIDKKAILANALTGWASILLRAGIAFLMVPFLIGNLGKEGYGFVGILGILLGLSQIADLGLRSALGRELSEKYAAKDLAGYQSLTATALWLYTFVALLLSATLFFLAPALVSLFNVSISMTEQAAFLIRLYGIPSITLAFVEPVFVAILSSKGDFKIINNIRSATSLLSAICLFVFVSTLTNKLLSWVIVMLFINVVRLFVTVLYSYQYSGSYRFQFSLPRSTHIKSLFSLGGYMYSLKLTEVLAQSSDPMVISHFFGPAGVALYQPGTRLSQVFRPLVCTLSNQLYPLTTHHYVNNDKSGMQSILVYGTKYTLLLGVIAVVAMISLASPLCKLWLWDSLGNDYSTVAIVLTGWAIADFLSYAAGTQFAVLLGMKKLKFLMWTQLPTAIINLLLSVYLVGFTSLGIPGVLAATIAIGVLRRPILISYTARICGLPVWDYFRLAYLNPLIVLVTLGIISYVMRLLWFPTTWLAIVLFAVILFFVWSLLSYFLVLSQRERVTFSSIMLNREVGLK